MTVKELKELLDQYDDETPVHFSYNFGDHWRTQVAPEVRGVDELYVKHSSYHNMPCLMDDEDTELDHDSVVVLR